MLLSRFWYVILAIFATIGVMSALVASSIVNEQQREAVIDDLRRDRFEVEAILKLDARSRLDAIAPFAANADVRTALRQASARARGAAVPEELSARLRTKLGELNTQLAGFRGDLVFAVDDEGWIVAAIAPGRVPPGAGLGQFPLVARALEGYVRDDVWVFNDGVYRMAARPVIDNGQYVGAIVHGKRFDDQLAELLSTRLGGASVAFFRGTTIVAGYMPADVGGAPRRDDMGKPLAQVLEDERLRAGERTDPRDLDTGGLAVYSLVTGTAHHANVGYAIARPVPRFVQPWDLLLNTPSETWTDVLKLWWIWAVLAALVLVAMLSVWLERDRPLGTLRRATAALVSSPGNRLTVTDFGGQYRTIALQINEALDRAADAGGAPGPKRKAANLDEILGPAGDAPQPSFFGFATKEESAPVELPEVPAAPAPSASAAAAPSGAPTPASPPAPTGGLAPPRPPAPPPAPAVKTPPPKPPAPPVAKPAAPPAPPPPETTVSEPAKPAAPPMPGPSKVATGVPAGPAKPDATQRKLLKRTLLGVPPPAEDDDDEGATMVARVPEELLAKSAAPGTEGADDEEKHFREVFEQFLETKRQCGEPTAGLTFEKFVITLRKNRDQIVSRHGARSVRFTVYVKEGKAALKATPIKQ